MTVTAVCIECGVKKPTVRFSVDNKRKSGIRARCKMCDAAAAKASRERKREREKARAQRAHEDIGNRTPAPPWLTEEQFDEISGYYELARFKSERTGILHVVDHVVPIDAPMVCGLHVPWNLQVLTVQEDAIKGTSFDSGWR